MVEQCNADRCDLEHPQHHQRRAKRIGHLFSEPEYSVERSCYAGPYFYHISGRICDLTESKSWMTLAGDGPDSFVIKLMDATHKPTLPNESIIRVVGGTNPARGFSIRELTLNGTDRIKADPWIEFTNVANARLDRLNIFRTIGPGLIGKKWFDSVCHDVHFGRVGASGAAQMLLQSITPSDAATASRQLVFESCRWEQNPDYGCQLLNTLRILFLTCKWHGTLPNASNLNAHLWMQNALYTSVTGGRSTNSAVGHIYAKDSSSLLVGSSTFDGGTSGITLDNTDYSVISGNHFGLPFTAALNNSVVSVGGSANNVVTENAIRPS